MVTPAQLAHIRWRRKIDTTLTPEQLKQAACRDTPDPNIFFPDMKETSRYSRHREAAEQEAKAICRPCPIRAACLSEALEHNLWGIWGGTTWNERNPGRRRL